MRCALWRVKRAISLHLCAYGKSSQPFSGLFRTGSLKITYRVAAFRNSGKKLRVVGDASVFGFGANFMVEGEIVSWWPSALSPLDEKFIGIRVGDERCQQVSECLNFLVALRTWKQLWCTERVCLEVRADNVAALTLIMSLQIFKQAREPNCAGTRVGPG